jgi:CopG-like RHH_1 or ribbon-helix-helix domain, RHH_5
MPTRNPRVVVYLETDLKAKLEILADKRNRSISNLLETVIKEIVEQAEKAGELTPNNDKPPSPPTKSKRNSTKTAVTQ